MFNKDLQGKGEYRHAKRESIRIGDFGQFWGADFKHRCYTDSYGGYQPRFDAQNYVLVHKLEGC